MATPVWFIALWMVPTAVCLTPVSAVGQEQRLPDTGDTLNGETVTVTDRGTIEMHVADMPLATVLRILSLKGKRNIIASPNVTGTVTADLYDVRFDEALQAILVPNGAGFRTSGSFLYIYTEQELADQAAAGRDDSVTRVYRLDYLNARDAKAYIEPIIGEESTISISAAPASGLDSQGSEGGGASAAYQDFVIVTAPPHIQGEVEAVLKQLDVRPKQVLIEATILRAELTEDNALGIDFTIVGGVDLALMGARSNGLAELTLGRLPSDRLEQFNANASTDFRSNVPDGGLTIGIIKDQVGLFLRALESITDTVVIANPKVLALNKQKGQVLVGRRDGYLTTTVTETQAIQTVEFLETGTNLVFRPFIASDGFIRVELHPEDSAGFVSAQGLPTEQTTEVTTNVIVRDGETILIAGLFREVTNDARSQIPVLGNLPGVGSLFRSRNDGTAREEVIILMTLHVVKDEEAYARDSLDVAEDVERLRVGLREGLMWTGRDRLTQSHYRNALKAMGQGDESKALWYLTLARSASPRFLPAIELRERILAERAWSLEGTASRAFLRKMIARDRGYPWPPFARPAIPKRYVPAAKGDLQDHSPQDDADPADRIGSP